MEMSFGAKILVFGCFLAYAELKPITLDPSAGPIILVRLKRSPNLPNRAFTFSGFNPSTGYSAFATSADFYPSYYRYFQSPPSPPSPASLLHGKEDHSSPSSPSGESDSSYNYPPSVEIPSSNGSEEDRKIPSPVQSLTPPGDSTPVSGFGANENSVHPAPPKKPKKKPNRVNPAEEEEYEENDSKPRSSSSASFNAWFPIVLGSYPSNSNSESSKDGGSPARERSSGSTVIANSVSNGRSGVASSHAVLYGGESPVQKYQKY